MPTLRTRIKERRWNIPLAMTVWLHPPPAEKLACTGRESGYTFKNRLPEAQDDPVIRMIIYAIRRLEREDLCMAAAKIRVYNATSSRPIWPPTHGNSDSAVKFYIFHPYYEEFPMTVPITVLPDRGRLTPGAIQVRFQGEWKRLIDWLPTILNRDMLLDGYKRSLQSQQISWAKNGKSFPFMRLPPEIRRIIYREVIGDEIHPFKVAKGGPVTLGRPVPRDAPFSYTSDFFERVLRMGKAYVNLNILYTNRKIRGEALQAAWEGTWKHFENSYNFQDIATEFVQDDGRGRFSSPSIGRPQGYNWLSRIELNLYTREYFEFFGARLTLVHRQVQFDWQQSPGALLRTIPTLTHLSLGFKNPYCSEENWITRRDPWGQFYENNYEALYNMGLWAIFPQCGCHRTAVEWILNFAFPCIKHIRCVILTGCVKTVQKRAWEAILATEYKESALSYRTHGYDWEEEMAKIKSATVYDAPVCSCPLSCIRYEAMDQLHSEYLDLAKNFDHHDESTPEILERVIRVKKQVLELFGANIRVRNLKLFGRNSELVALENALKEVLVHYKPGDRIEECSFLARWSWGTAPDDWQLEWSCPKGLLL
ncbi:uncharacterized protein EI97DRAFT_490228 [Westerdykella ornata]|uniref:Uncharacterized protein n=1 Tax=Westerdykella ornata TaxID=318751 RepID=A0A6A6JLD3_WESOR|nr:uncharacterized protein EI97DRAFT_490228 [Westerdykella ornata]KAF2276758.1 hypothetical protein EI97DRAFT_490228 [Westerdykella ornata]